MHVTLHSQALPVELAFVIKREDHADRQLAVADGRLAVRIERVIDVDTLDRGAQLFDDPPDRDTAYRFLNTPGHHLLFAFEDERPVGFVSGAELVHPDKGIEMYLNELGVDEQFQGRGIATQLVEAMIDLAKELGCRGMWDVTEPDNAAAIATYRRAGADDVAPCVIFGWTF